MMSLYHRFSMNKLSQNSRHHTALNAARRVIVAIWFTIMLAFLLVSSKEASSAELSAVTLMYFRGTGQENAVLLEWATGTEFETAGFRLSRATEESGQYLPLDQIGFIPGEGDGIVGAQYEVVDSNGIANGVVYWYKLIELELNGTENPAGPISVTAGAVSATATSTPVPTATGTQPGGGDAITPTPEPHQGENTPTMTPAVEGSPAAITQGTNASPSNSILQPPPPGAVQQSTPVTGASSSNANSPGSGGTVSPDETLNISGYPAPATNDDSQQGRESRSSQGEGYPNPESISPTTEPGSYPQGNEDRLPDLTPPPDSDDSSGSAQIGSLNVKPIESRSEDNEPSQSSNSSITLWLGFIASVLIFGAAVIGSIVYFSRQRMQGR